MTDRKAIEIQCAIQYDDHRYTIEIATRQDDGNIYLYADELGVVIDTPEQIDEIIKALQKAKTWLK